MTAPLDDGALLRFLERYPPRPYHRRNGDYPSVQLELVALTDGLCYLNEVLDTLPKGTPRRSHEESGENCHLWVVDERGRPCISEAPLARLGDDNLHHTNITGGGRASIGGEVWFDDTPRVYVSGSSGRYPPLHKEHLEDAELLFRTVGFDVVSLGWDAETDKPRRVWLGQGSAVQE